MSEYAIRRLENSAELLQLKDDWDRLYLANPRLTHFQSFAWNSGLVARRAFRGALRVYLLYRDGRLVLIAPLAKVRRGAVAELVFIGHDTHADYLDFIYDDLQPQDLDHLVRRIRSDATAGVVTLAFMHQGSRAAALLGESGLARGRVASRCFSIGLAGGVDDYKDRLGKSTRKEINAGTNRLAREHPEHRYEFTLGRQLERDRIRGLLRTYRERLADKHLRFRFSEAYLEFLTDYVAESRDVFLAELYLREGLAAFNLGFVGRDREIHVLIVSSDTRFKRLNAGNLLLYNTVCHLIETARGGGLDVANYDLTRGAELYKLKYGGAPHDVLSFTLAQSPLVYAVFNLRPALVGIVGQVLRFASLRPRRAAPDPAEDENGRLPEGRRP